ELDYSHMARISFSDLISRFDFQSLNLKDISKKNISKMYWLAKSLNYNCEKLERWFIIKNSIIEKQEDNNYLQNGIIHRKRFSDMSTQEFIIYFEKNILVEEDMNSFIYYLSSNAYEDDELKYIIKTLICRNERVLGRNEHIKNLKKSFEVFLSNDLKAYMLTCVFCVEEDGWLNRFVNIDVFAEAYELDKEITINTLFECIYEHLERMGYHNSIGSYLINALTKINYDKEMVKNMWGELYNIISFRLPEKIELNWDKILQNDFEMDNTELLQSIVLTRLNHGELVRQKIIISGISYLMEQEIQKLQKPLKWFFSNKDKFTNISIILILQLILEQDDYSNEELKGTLLEIYPVPNYMINILLEEICEIYIENKPKLPQVQVNYKPTEKQKEMLMLQHTEVGKIDRAGLDISQIAAQYYKKLYGGLGEEIGKLFYNRSQKILIPNIYEKDLIISIINEELYEYDNNGLLDDYDELELYCCVAPDIKTIVAYENTLSIRPQNMLRPKQYQQDIFESYMKDADRQWIRLAYWEEELVKINYTSFEIHEVLQGIVFCEEKLSLPFGHLYTKDIWGYPEILGVNNEKPICMDVFSDSFINYRILWLNPLFIKLLGLKVKSMNCGLSAVNEQEEVVLLLKSWKTSYLGNDEFPSYELPCLKGNELVIREDYFEKLCSIIGKAPKKQLIKKSYKI
ncbi:hypothetical protein P4H09_24050, partial [Bacillus cereus]|nr:hypothetical protein [Bacillus cereus]